MKSAAKKQWTIGALALAFAAATASGARAQMGGDGPPPPPPAGAPQGGPLQGGPGRGAPRGNRTPEQMQAQRVQMLKRMLEGAGVIDVQVQNTVVAFSAAREEATRGLQEKSRAIFIALRSATATEAEIATVLNDFRAAVAAEKTRRARAEADLEAATMFSKKPRLDAVLTVMGLVGDEAAFAGGGGRGMAGGRGPEGRRGGGPNGGRNRRGPNGESRRGGADALGDE